MNEGYQDGEEIEGGSRVVLHARSVALVAAHGGEKRRRCLCFSERRTKKKKRERRRRKGEKEVGSVN